MQYLMTVHPDKVTVLNTAISGSRLIHDAPHDQPIYETFGESLLSRMVRNRSGFKPELTIVSIGANDLMLPLISEVAARQKITKDNFFNAVQRLNEILEKRNSELILLDIPPFTLSHTGRPDDKELQAQKFRKELNSKLATIPETVPTSLLLEMLPCGVQSAYDFGDHMHINQAGGRVVATKLIPKIEQELFH